MKQTAVTVQFKEGLHARPAVKLIKLIKGMSSKITIEKNGESFAADSITSILSACVMCGDKIVVRAQGDDEESAIKTLEEYFL